MTRSSDSKPAFATATRPVADSTLIHTDAVGLLAGDVSIPVTDGSIPAYRAAPAAQGKHPVVLVIQEIFGVHEHIRDVSRRLAKLGYFAIAPELYHRQGDVSQLEGIDEIRKVVAKVPDAQVLADLDASVAWAKQQGADGERLGITGFCWGGRITWLYAAHQPAVKAGVAWYGRLIGEPTPLQPRFPIDIAGELKVPVLGLYGGADQGIPLESVEQVRGRLAETRGASTIHVYPDAPHAFYADYRPSYRKSEAEDGFERLKAWFEQHGV
jgi:carboxymethylenebutenolidase